MIQNKHSNQLTVNDTKRVFLTDKNFFLSKPSCQQPKQQSLGGRQESWRLLAEREKFAQHVMVSAGVCFGGKGRLHFVFSRER